MSYTAHFRSPCPCLYLSEKALKTCSLMMHCFSRLDPKPPPLLIYKMQTHTHQKAPRSHQGATASLLQPLRHGVVYFLFFFFGLIKYLVPSLRRKIAEGKKKLVMKCFSICIPESLNSRLPSLFVRRQETAAALMMSIPPPPYRSLINLTAMNKHHQYASKGGIWWLLLSKDC